MMDDGRVFAFGLLGVVVGIAGAHRAAAGSHVKTGFRPEVVLANLELERGITSWIYGLADNRIEVAQEDGTAVLEHATYVSIIANEMLDTIRREGLDEGIKLLLDGHMLDEEGIHQNDGTNEQVLAVLQKIAR
jgi:hypothetical protein